MMKPDMLSRQLFHRVRDKVLAAWNGDRVLVRTALRKHLLKI